MRNFALIFMLMLPLTVHMNAQEYSTESKRAIKQFEQARYHFQLQQDTEAEEFLLKALKADERFTEAWFMLAQIYLDKDEGVRAAEYFLKGLEAHPGQFTEGYLKVAGVEYDNGLYESAQQHLDIYISALQKSARPDGAARTDLPPDVIALQENIRFALDAMANPVPFDPESLGDGINRETYEYWPSLSVDEKQLFFTVLEPQHPDYPPTRLKLQEDFYFSEKEGDRWGARINLGPPVNTNSNEGAQAITADGKLIYFTACNRPDGHGRMCDIYVSRLENGSWSKPENLGDEINTGASEKHPAISADGRTLIFTSNRRGGSGDYDLWISRKTPSGWSKPENMGDSINTSGSEQSPFIHPDQQTLYFASNGWPGMGKADLYISRLREDGSWSKPENLGYPINTHNQEIGLVVNAGGTRAYYSSNRREGTDTDIFAFDLPEQLRPVPVSYISGRVYDARNMRGIAATFQLIDLQNGDVVMESRSEAGEGDYFVSLPTGTSYAFNVSHPGYLFYSGNFSIDRSYTRLDPLVKDIPLEPVMEGRKIVLNNIFYEVDAFALKAESRVELQKVVEFMERNPQVRIEISGHTDNTGSTAYNMQLSENRAQEVVSYLEEQGIRTERLVARGYGESMPVAGNETEAERARNRRTELKILSVEE